MESFFTGNYDDEIYEIKQDTRLISREDTFIAFKGDNVDGNKFVANAIQAGASTCIVNDRDIEITDEIVKKKCNILYTPDSLKALQNIIDYKMDEIDTKVIAITRKCSEKLLQEKLFHMFWKQNILFLKRRKILMG